MNILDIIGGWTGSVSVGSSDFENTAKIPSNFDFSAGHIILMPNTKPAEKSEIQPIKSGLIRITVKQYMTKKATADFDFMRKYNSDVPMPLRTMVGTVEKETRGMVYMKLHGDTDGKPVMTCMRCGKPITNKVSQFFGLGPECGQHNYVNPFVSDEELTEAVDNYRRNVLQKMTWEGWVIKSAILTQEEI